MWRDNALLFDMLSAAKAARSHIAKVSYDTFASSALHQDAVLRQLMVIGEAAAHVSDEIRRDLKEIEWFKVVGMRHRLVHDYRRVDLSRVWQTVLEDLPPLIEVLERSLPPEED